MDRRAAGRSQTKLSLPTVEEPTTVADLGLDRCIYPESLRRIAVPELAVTRGVSRVA